MRVVRIRQSPFEDPFAQPVARLSRNIECDRPFWEGCRESRRCSRDTYPETCFVCGTHQSEREFFIDNLLVRIHFIIVMIRWSGLAP